jgi:hypothetical protein
MVARTYDWKSNVLCLGELDINDLICVTLMDIGYRASTATSSGIKSGFGACWSQNLKHTKPERLRGRSLADSH